MITLAQEAAKLAGEVLRANFGRASLVVETKGDADLVTDVDRLAEDAVRELLEREVPEHSRRFEEGGRSGESEWEWIVDALDGTTNFIHRYPFFAVSIALAHRGRAVLGVVYDPLRGEMFTAESGEGTRLNGIEVSVSRTGKLTEALLGTGFPIRHRSHLEDYLRMFAELAGSARGIRRDGSAALDLAYVAAGRLDGFWELGLRPWDMAAGAVLVASAGGRVTDFAGGDDFLEGGDVLVSNGALHEVLQTAAETVWGTARPGLFRRA